MKKCHSGEGRNPEDAGGHGFRLPARNDSGGRRCAYCGHRVDEIVLRADYPGLYFCTDACHQIYRLVTMAIDVGLTQDEMSLILSLLNGPWKSDDPAVMQLRESLGRKLATIYGRQRDLIADAQMELQRPGYGKTL